MFVKFKTVSIFLFCLLLTGCGFHVRGHEPLPPVLRTLYIKTCDPYSALMKQLQRTFGALHICLVNSPLAAPVTLQILTDSFTQSSAAVSSGAQLTNYTLIYTINYQLLNSSGVAILPPRTVSTTRTTSINSNQILGDTSAISTLQDQMRRDVIYQLLNQLRSPITVRALSCL